MATEPNQMTGKVVNGVIVLENGQRLPDGTMVNIEPVGETAPPKSVPQVSQLREMLLNRRDLRSGIADRSLRKPGSLPLRNAQNEV